MPPMRRRQARSAEAKCLLSSWRGVSDFSTPLCVSAPVQAQPRPYRRAKRPDLAKRPPAARATPPTVPTVPTPHHLFCRSSQPRPSRLPSTIRLLHSCGADRAVGLAEGGDGGRSPLSSCGTKGVPGTGPDRDLVTQDGPGVRLSLLDEVRRGRGSACSNWLAVMRQERHNPQYVRALTRRLGSRSVRLRIGGGDRFKTRVRGPSAGAATGTQHDVFDVM